MTNDIATIWIEDGILCNTYLKRANLDEVLRVIEDDAKLLAEQQIALIPIIISFHKDVGPNFDIKFTDFPRILQAVHIMSRISDIWMIAEEHEISDILRKANIFIGNKIHFAPTIEQAKKEIKASSFPQRPFSESAITINS